MKKKIHGTPERISKHHPEGIAEKKPNVCFDEKVPGQIPEWFSEEVIKAILGRISISILEDTPLENS